MKEEHIDDMRREVQRGMMMWRTGTLNHMMRCAKRDGEDTSLYMEELERRMRLNGF